MIKEFEFYHGSAITRLIHSKKPISVRSFPNHGNASYVINEKIGLYLKYSTNRLTPWRFSFQKDHQAEIDELKSQFGDIILGLICFDDGIVGLDYSEIKTILDSVHSEVEWVSVSRKPRGQYSVNGSDGELFYKISEGDFLKKVLREV